MSCLDAYGLLYACEWLLAFPVSLSYVSCVLFLQQPFNFQKAQKPRLGDHAE
jgi:hypothetical protein